MMFYLKLLSHGRPLLCRLVLSVYSRRHRGEPVCSPIWFKVQGFRLLTDRKSPGTALPRPAPPLDSCFLFLFVCCCWREIVSDLTG